MNQHFLVFAATTDKQNEVHKKMHRNNIREGTIITRIKVLCYILVMIIVFCGLPSYAAAEGEENPADELNYGISDDSSATAPVKENRLDEGTDQLENSVSEDPSSLEESDTADDSTETRVTVESEEEAQPEQKTSPEESEDTADETVPAIDFNVLGAVAAEIDPYELIQADKSFLFEYKTLSMIALTEANASDSIEFPYGSDCVKYNNWAYGYRVCNPFDTGCYDQKYGWNAAFVSWCADQMSLLDFGRFPKTTDGSEMRRWFIDHGALEFTKWEMMSPSLNLVVQADDLLFYFDGETYRVAIIIAADSDTIAFAEGDADCRVEIKTVDIDSLPENASVIRWKRDNDFLLPYLIYLCQEVQFTPTAAIGVLTNIMYESEFNPHAIGDDGTSYGLCQWHLLRWQKLIEACTIAGQDWTRPEGQMYYLKLEMEEFDELRNQMNELPNSPDGAYQAAFLFCITFECPEAASEAGMFRGYIASDRFYPSLLSPEPI